MSSLLMISNTGAYGTSDVITTDWSAAAGDKYGNDPKFTMLHYKSVLGDDTVVLDIPFKGFIAYVQDCQKSGAMLDLTDIEKLQKTYNPKPDSPSESFAKGSASRKSSSKKPSAP